MCIDYNLMHMDPTVTYKDGTLNVRILPRYILSHILMNTYGTTRKLIQTTYEEPTRGRSLHANPYNWDKSSLLVLGSTTMTGVATKKGSCFALFDAYTLSANYSNIINIWHILNLL
jgi:hypothetical protein